ncbi:hypothetical protein EV356DRAFT_458031, partial [Viridothelium virens]
IIIIALICMDGTALLPHIIYALKTNNIKYSWINNFKPKEHTSSRSYSTNTRERRLKIDKIYIYLLLIVTAAIIICSLLT